MEDWFTAICGLIGVILGSVFTLFTSWLSKRDNDKKELRDKEDEVYDKFAEPRKITLNKLCKESDQCATLLSELKRIKLSTSSNTLKLYEENGVYPLIQVTHYNEYDSSTIWDSVDTLIGNLYVHLSIYEELRNIQSIDKNKIEKILNEINQCATKAYDECFKEHMIVISKIQTTHGEVLQDEIDSLNRRKNRKLKDKRKSEDVQ